MDPLQPETRHRVLLVDDDEKILSTQKRVLESIGFDVDTVGTGAEAVERAQNQRYDVFLVDMHMEPHDGAWTCRTLLTLDPDAIVMMLSAVEKDEAKVAAFEAGATDYVIKSVTYVELGARIRGHIRRLSRPGTRTLLRFGRLTADPKTLAVYVDGQLAKLSEQQTALLWVLLEAPGKFYTAEELHAAIDSENKLTSTRRALQRLRQPLGECGHMIQVLHGRGYGFDPTG